MKRKHIAGLAVSNIAWPASANSAVRDMLVDLGVSGVEIAPTAVWSDPLAQTATEVARLRAYWEDHGIRIVALQALLYGREDLVLFGSGEARKAALDHLRGMIRLAGMLGAHALVFGSPGNRRRGGLPRAAAEAVAIPFFTDIATAAEDHGVTFCIEPNPPHYKCDYLNTTAEVVEIVSKVNRAGLGIHLDAAAITLNGEDPGSAVHIASPRLRHFHISEPRLAPIGSGSSPHEALSNALSRAGYEGWVSIEMRADMQADPVAHIRKAVEYALDAYQARQ